MRSRQEQPGHRRRVAGPALGAVRRGRPRALGIENGLHWVLDVTMNEDLFAGHFPGQPLFPGVLQIEAMAQTGGILVLNTVPDPENYITLFLKIENARFKDKVVPGDTLIFYCNLIAPIRRGIAQMKGIGMVGSRIVVEAELMAQIVRKTKEEKEA